MDNLGSLNLTFYDIITHLIPGSILLVVIYLVEGFKLPLPSEILLIVFLFSSFIVGQILLVIGNLMFNTYIHPSKYQKGSARYWVVFYLHNIIKKIVRQNYDNYGLNVKPELILLIEKKFKLKKLNDQSLFQLSDTLVSELGFSERDILLAKQGFYRSASALAALSIPYLMVKGGLGIPVLFWLILLVLLLRLFLYAHTYYGQIRKNQVYLLAYKKLEEI